MVIRLTTRNSGHRHNWEFGKITTTRNRDHNHKINFPLKIAVPNVPNGHFHRLLKTISPKQKRRVNI